ncbi:MAG: hypothetical protein OEO77_11840 [Acidimicrobiia bacterium]|nr:hypothetical protein [Acidimicrobiia bacterium]
MADNRSTLRTSFRWAIFGILPVWALLSWVTWLFLRPPSSLDVVVYDVTVPDDRFVEHASLAYLFDHEKIALDVRYDYVGAAPGGAPYGQWPDSPPDLLILADGYGVYADEFGRVSDVGRTRITERLEIVDAERVLAWIEAGTFVVGEFNIFEDPTVVAASEILQQPFGVDPVGWTGRYFEDLANVPGGLRVLTGEQWEYEGPGILLVSGPAGDRSLPAGAIVLSGADLDEPVPRVVGTAPNRWATVHVPFYAWFEVTEAMPGTEVDAVFEIEVSESGAALLQAAGVPSRFPALVHNDSTLYFAGDGLEVVADFPFHRMVGGPRLIEWARGLPEERLFRKLYLPALSWAIAQAGD